MVNLDRGATPIRVHRGLDVPATRAKSTVTRLARYPRVSRISVLDAYGHLRVRVIARRARRNVHRIARFLSRRDNLPLPRLHRRLFVLLRRSTIGRLVQITTKLSDLILKRKRVLTRIGRTRRLTRRRGDVNQILSQLLGRSLATKGQIHDRADVNAKTISVDSTTIRLTGLGIPGLSDYGVDVLKTNGVTHLLIRRLGTGRSYPVAVLGHAVSQTGRLTGRFPSTRVGANALSTVLRAIRTSSIIFAYASTARPVLRQRGLRPVLSNDHALVIFSVSMPLGIRTGIGRLPGIRTFGMSSLGTIMTRGRTDHHHVTVRTRILLSRRIRNFVS